MNNITTKGARAQLPVRPEAYWLKLRAGAYLGFRRGPDTWQARYWNGHKQSWQPLGGDLDYAAAKAKAEAWLDTMMSGAHRTPSRGSVRDALSSYVRHLRAIGRRHTAWETGQRFRLTVPRDGDFSDMRLENVRRDDVEAWRKGLRTGRQPRSVNRQVRAVIAALNWAVKDGGHVGNREAWKLTHLIDEGEESTPVFLTAEQRDRLIAAASPTAAALLTGFSHTGARPSELARATVADFDSKGGTVTLSHRKGRGAKLRTRATQLDDKGAKFFKNQVRGKLPRAPLIANLEGGHFTDQQWCREIELAIVAANKTAKKPWQRIPVGASAYSFRHTRISELLQVYGVDPLTTAQQTGTSVVMIEKFYFKFISSSMRDKLNAVKGKGAK